MDFYEVLAPYYDLIFPVSVDKLKFVQAVFPDKAGKLLDVGCATGELSFQLSALGYPLAGVDMAADLITLAHEKKSKRGKAAEPAFIQGDMRFLSHYFTEKSFQGILCLGNTLAHLASEADICQTLAEMKKLLTKNGKVIIQLVNFDQWQTKTTIPLPRIENDTLIFERIYMINSAKTKITFQAELTLKSSGQSFRTSTLLWPLFSKAMTNSLQSAGFNTRSLFGNFAFAPYNESSPALIVLAAI
jgi:2-polyprenyl-3-methyl-5-hydroxy-6-metoxy-1,4-benzoquinol methylase